MSRASRTRRSPRALLRAFPFLFSRGGYSNPARSGQGSGKTQNASGGLGLSFCFVRLGHGVHHLAIRPRAFPLGLLAPRCLCAACFLALPPAGGCSGRLLFGGRKESFPRLRPPPRSFGVRPRTTPILVCIRGFVVVRVSVASANGGAHPWARTPVAEMPEAGKSMCT
jgi:hypothetical protein